MPLRNLYFLTWVWPPPPFFNNVQKNCRSGNEVHPLSWWSFADGRPPLRHPRSKWLPLLSRFVFTFYSLLGQVLSHKMSCRLRRSSGWSWNPLRLRWPLAYSIDTWSFVKIIPSHIFQTAVQQKCQVTASNGNGNDDGSDEGGSIEPSSSTSVSMTSFLLIASILVLSI